jgi:hypothetical protein
MGEILVSVLGKKLYFLPEDFDRRTKFPSPNDLKERVLIKSSGSLEKAVELLFNKKLG